jgi:hypothetical protein
MLSSFMDAVWKAVENEGFDVEGVFSKENTIENVHVRCAVSQLLFYRFELSQTKISKILKQPKSQQVHFYVNHMDRRHYDEFNMLVDALDDVADRYEEYISKFN